jgi:DNA invertase Pin-like site-specific DNA recombinase
MTLQGIILAFSYLRFSTPGQADGDSVQRQTTLRDAWLRRHPEVKLDTSLTFQDKGVSGYRGSNRTNKKHALAQFLDLVERGRVPAGSYLIVENLDRLTREEPEVSIPLVMNLIQAGIKVVQLAPTEMVYEPGMDFGRLMMLWELARGHGESKRKSGLLESAWLAKKNQARQDRTPHGRMCPAWLELVDGTYRVKEDAARAIRKIFRWCVEGKGTLVILDRLNKAGIPAIGKTGEWDASYVHKILTTPAVYGEYQPHKGNKRRTPDGDPIADYYPRVIDPALFHAAQAAIRSRKRRTGRPATTVVNPFSGLLWSATDGSKLQVCGCRGYKYLVSRAAMMQRQGVRWCTFPINIFVQAVLAHLRELRATDLFTDPSALKVQELEGRQGEVERRLAVALERFHADPESPTWADQVTQLDREKRALKKELDEARQAAANPIAGAWEEAVELMARDESERLRGALLSTLEGVWVVMTTRGKDRLAAVQVWFKGGGQFRNYLLLYRPARANGKAVQVGRWWARSNPGLVIPGGRKVIDLRQPEFVEPVLSFLVGLQPENFPAEESHHGITTSSGVIEQG